MTKEQKTRAATIGVLVLALGIALAQKESWRLGRAAPKEPPTPQDAVYAMLDAARAGDVTAYLSSYTGSLQASLQQSVRESTEPAFAKYLQDSNAALKGVAVGEPQTAADGQTSIRVEYIYQDRNEAQTIHLEMAAGAWKIARVDGTEPVKTLVPYGTPVR